MKRTSFSSVAEPWLDDKPVVLVAGGPSLVGFDFSKLADFHVVAVKASIFDVPAVCGFGLDFPRIQEWVGNGKMATVKMPVYWGFDDYHLGVLDLPDCVVPLRRVVAKGLSEQADTIYSGGSSGYGALNLVTLKRAKRIVLLGYDYGGNKDGIWHHNEQHYDKKRRQDAQNWRTWAYAFDEMLPQLRAAGVTVINACPHSAITAFLKMDIDDALTHIRRI